MKKLLVFMMFISFYVLSDDQFPINENKYLRIGGSVAGHGLFSMFSIVIGGLDKYESNEFTGVVVDFEDKGEYYETQYGMNYWNYYFAPIKTENKNNDQIFLTDSHYSMGMLGWHALDLNRNRVNELINKYITINDNVISIANELIDFIPKNKIKIGVHYRGTDKKYEQPRIKYKRIEEEIVKALNLFHYQDYMIVLATDEQAFIDFLEFNFPDKVFYYKDALRSNDDSPLHMSGGNRYKKGEDALIDCLLLSKCDILLRTSSNLSWAAGCFNKEMPILEIR